MKRCSPCAPRDRDPAIPVSAIGRFSDRQSAIAAQAKLAYATGREPDLVDLNDIQGAALIAGATAPLATSRVETARGDDPPGLFLFLPQDMLEDPQALPILGAMDNLPGFRLNLILPGRGKEQIKASRHAGLTVYGYAEIAPMTLAALADIAVFFGDGVPGERMAAFAIHLMRSEKVVIDCTSGAGFQSSGAPALRGPEDLVALVNYLQHTVLVNRREIGRQAATDPWLAGRGIEELERAIGLAPPETRPYDLASTGRTVFMPTNGVGLGHARRSTLVAEAMAEPGACAFAAFPSCVPFIQEKGFDCLPLVQKSPAHPEEHANDLLTYLRLSRVLRRGDRFVFDGGYVFDSIHHVILEKGLDAVWIRRGLWQRGQSLQASLDRERVFRTVIVPGEAFDELNSELTFGRQVHSVGPIVPALPAMGKRDHADRRKALAERLGVDFGELTVTMLGSGVATDRTAQMQALSVLHERRRDGLHLIVVWPGAAVPPGLGGWKNTRVVQTKDALSLCQIADLVVSASGYNSFHELLYHAVPTIFVPQMATFTDDQERRARAASDRGLAETVLAHELLLLEREVTAFLDDGKSDAIRTALAEVELPARGNAEAARLIDGRGCQ